MPNLTEFFCDDHRACDASWAAVEAAADAGDAAGARDAWRTFTDALERHFRMEEESLFPAFEEATGMRGGGPTMVMRSEHAQMRALVGQMEALVEEGDLDALVDQGDTLLMLIQQHNAKEEGMLYPMAEQHLSPAQWQAMHASFSR
ncbi:MAG: hemerythrin domain-containing protein [Myxococcales bacterium]|nr:hemerythrin domain-containing protein [Myxococcales bacterium]